MGLLSLFNKTKRKQSKPELENSLQQNKASANSFISQSTSSLSAGSANLAQLNQGSENHALFSEGVTLAAPTLISAPAVENHSDFDHFEKNSLQVISSDIPPELEAAAILFANGLMDQTEIKLKELINNDLVSDRKAWLMLFDFYQITKNRADFEKLSMEFIRRHETSPPSWREIAATEDRNTPSASPIQNILLPIQLDHSIKYFLDSLSIDSANNLQFSSHLQLDFASVAEIDVSGADELYRFLRRLQKGACTFHLENTSQLQEKILLLLHSDSESQKAEPLWLLLFEILRATQQKELFEKISIDYCIQFQISPPSFDAPASIRLGPHFSSSNTLVFPTPSEAFKTEAVIEGPSALFFNALQIYSETQNSAIVIDCSELQRIDFNAAAIFLNILIEILKSGKTIELIHTNYLVTILFFAIGIQHVARIVPSK